MFSQEKDDVLGTVWLMMNWKHMFEQATGSAFPDSYFCFDVETSGFSREKDLILEWGHCLVDDRKVSDRNSILLNWYESDVVPADWLTQRLATLSRDMALDGRSWNITAERIRDEGVPPKEGLRFIHELLSTIHNQGLFMVSHNGWNFDVPMIQNHLSMDLGIDFEFDPARLIDTGSLEKASQLIPNHPEAMPQANETLEVYCKRISAWRAKGVFYNLDRHCLQKYKLATKHNIDESMMHSAGQDAWVLHLLMEEFRDLYNTNLLPDPKVVAPSRPVAPVAASPVKTRPAAGPVNYRKQRNR